MAMSAVSSRDVFLYIPNIIGNSMMLTTRFHIGYVRVILAVAAFVFIKQPYWFLSLYATSCLLDVADGYAARYLSQCTLSSYPINLHVGSRFGAVLDMVTDRSTTAGLLCHLCTLYPSWEVLFQLLVGLDLSSHYMHMYATLAAGATSHKTLDGSHNWLLRLYYTSREVMFIACAGNETFFMMLYMAAYKVGPVMQLSGFEMPAWLVVAVACAPIWAFKQVMNLIQLIGAARKLASMDATPIRKTN